MGYHGQKGAEHRPAGSKGNEEEDDELEGRGLARHKVLPPGRPTVRQKSPLCLALRDLHRSGRCGA